MRDTLSPPAQAYAPDADRAGPEGTAQMPEWLLPLITRLILFMLEHYLAGRLRRGHRRPPWWLDQSRRDLPPGSAQAEAAVERGPFGRSIAWMCRCRGIGPGHADWPELSRAIVAFGGSLKGFRAGAPALGLLWWQTPNLGPGMVGETAAARSADAIALRLARQVGAATLAPALNADSGDIW